MKYNNQPEFSAHVGHMTELQERGLTVLSGPFMEKAGGLNGVLSDGGMTIFKASDLSAAIKIAEDDPTVKSGILKSGSENVLGAVSRVGRRQKMKRLEGKVAVVTGGSSGMGLAIARQFVAEGATVVITGRR